MIRRILPHPVLSLAVALIWLLLVNRFAWGSLVFALVLGLVVPVATAPYWPGRTRLARPLGLINYTGIVIHDIVKANIDVARIVLFKPKADLRPCWLVVPLDLTAPEAIAVLMGTITLTPGTVSQQGRRSRFGRNSTIRATAMLALAMSIRTMPT